MWFQWKLFKKIDNKANLRDLTAATSLVILLKLDSNHRFFSPCDSSNLMNDLKKHNRAPLLYYIKLCASFHNHQRIQTGVTVWKCSIRVKIGNILSRVTLKFDGWHKKTIGHLFYIMPSLVHHFKVMGWIQIGVTVRKRLIRVKISDFLSRVILKFDRWHWKTIAHLFYAT